MLPVVSMHRELGTIHLFYRLFHPPLTLEEQYTVKFWFKLEF